MALAKRHEEHPGDYRWHHELHSSVQKDSPTNGLPNCIRGLFHPTHALLSNASEGELAWTSRNHRKNRLRNVTPTSGQARHGKNIWQGFGHMTRIEYWNISWWVAMAFTLGSIIWVINGFASFLPFCNSHFQKADNSTGWSAWLGATVFEFGSVFGMWEAWNRADVADFGWGIERSMHHRKPGKAENSRVGKSAEEGLEQDNQSRKPAEHWVWFSTDGKYWHEIGFLAAFAQFCAATIFWISGFTAIPSIQSSIQSRTGLLDGVFWTPQVVGGLGFVISATLLMLETQKKWYQPEPLSLGWQIGFWNFTGGIGFTLCGALGYAATVNSGTAYQSSLSTFWGGWAFLIGSVIQWYESVNSV